jgi:MOSC domain-containing protein YiiM
MSARSGNQADRTVHGGPDEAGYAYAPEDTAWWEREPVRPLGPGAFGENLSLREVDVSQARIGERWALGGAVLEVRQPRAACHRFIPGARPGPQ